MQNLYADIGAYQPGFKSRKTWKYPGLEIGHDFSLKYLYTERLEIGPEIYFKPCDHLMF